MFRGLSTRGTSCLALATTLCVLFGGDAAAQMQTSAAYTTTSDLRDVRPFDAWITDATFTPGVDIEPVLSFGDLDGGSTIEAGALAAVWVREGLEVGGRWGFRSLDPERGESRSGLQDLGLYTRYRLPLEVDADVALGTELKLPVGDEDVGEGNLDLEVFGAMRYDVDGDLTVLAHAGIQSIERFDDREAGILLGGGVLVPMTEELALISELTLATAEDDAAVTAGVDYELPPGGHLRAGLSLGLDDGAPDLELRLGFAIPVY